MDCKMLKGLLIAGILIGIQGCAGTTLNPFSEKPYFASPPAQMTQADRKLFDRALFRQTNNRIQPAIKVWNQFLEKHPRSFEARNNLGLVYFEDDQVDASIAELETALSLEPNESKIKKNLIRVLKFKATLYQEARDYNRAVDTLKHVQEISSPEQKEKIGFRIEEYEDKAYEQAKRIDTLDAYEGFLKRYPNSSKNSDEARMKIEGLKPRDMVFPDEKIITEDKAELVAPPAEDFVVSPEAHAKTSPANIENDGINAGNPMLEGSPMEGESKASMAEETPPVVENLDKGFIPVQPLEVPRSAEQKIEIATQVEPKPATGVDLFPSLEPDVSSQIPQISSPTTEDFPEVAKAQQRKVRIVTRRDPLRVRKYPTLFSRVLATVPKGSLVPLIREENGWYKIEFSTGQMGWISKKYSQLAE
ncbi:MAG: SH3 domain-containing protein [Nitrospinae bacterium]|nr:SH3 domain-containing protein [Nitrospinota bacterium]